MPSSSLWFSSAATLWAALLLLPFLADAGPCTESFLLEAKNVNITTTNCQLTTLGAEFAWHFDNASRHIEVAFAAKLLSSTAWLAWGLNPDGPHMVGTRALIGIKHQSGELQSRKYNITDATKRRCLLLPSDDDIGLNVTGFTFRYLHSIGYYVIHAAIVLSDDYNASGAHVVWQIGDVDADGRPRMHPSSLEHLDTAQTIDLVSGEVLSYEPGQRTRFRTAHGVLNIVGWGIFLPTGVMVARYLRTYPKQWKWWGAFHVGCQSTGYVLGSIGWAIGLWLGQASEYYTFTTHRILAIMLFTFTTIQMMALRLKPKRTDEYRTYWNMYHHFLGYSLLGVAAVNIFQGIGIIESGDHHHSWRWSYVGVLGVLGAVALSLELYTWLKFWTYWDTCITYLTTKNPKSATAPGAFAEPAAEIAISREIL